MSIPAFENSVHELATDLNEMVEGDSISGFQLGLAKTIASAINKHRDELKGEYILEPTRCVVENLEARLKQKGVIIEEETRFGVAALKSSLEEDIRHRRRIADWLIPLIPKQAKTEIKPMRVIKSLLNRPELGYTYEDLALAEQVLKPPSYPHLGPKVETKTSVQLEDYELYIIAEGILRFLARAAQDNKKYTKMEIYSSTDFATILRTVSKDAPARQTFHTAWEILVAFFEDCDATYQLFDYEGETRSRRYILKDPELAELMWGTMDDTQEDDSAMEPEKQLIRPFEGHIIRIIEKKLILDTNKTIALEDRTQHEAAIMLLQRGAQFVSTGRLTQQLCERLREPRSSIEPSLRSLLQSLGPNYVERRFSKRGSKELVRIRSTARAVLQQ